MIKVRITFVDDEKGTKELEKSKQILNEKFNIISESRIYKGRGSSKYSNIYFDLDLKK